MPSSGHEPESIEAKQPDPVELESAPAKRPPVLTYILVGLGAIALGAIFTSAPHSSKLQAMSDMNSAAAADALDEAGKNLEDMASTPATKPSTDRWTYTDNVDEVRGSTTYLARTTSTNTIHQDSPYDDATSMDILLRQSRKSGLDAMFIISSGQMMCPSYEGCSATVRFDNGSPQHIHLDGSADSSSEVVFVSGARSFLAKLRKAKRLVVEKTLYEAGSPQFTFDVSGLKWQH